MKPRLLDLILRFAEWWRGPDAPSELLDPDGEGIYLLNDWAHETSHRSVLRTAAYLFGLADERGRLDWRAVEHETVAMLPGEGDEWYRTALDWRLNLPRKWRPTIYAYCAPKPEPQPKEAA